MEGRERDEEKGGGREGKGRAPYFLFSLLATITHTELCIIALLLFKILIFIIVIMDTACRIS